MFTSACEKKAPPPPPPTPEVVVIPVAQRDVSIMGEWLGTTAGFVDTQIRARVSGYLIKQNYIEGGTVKAGDLLYEIDRRPFEVALAKAKANKAEADARQGKTIVDVQRLGPLAETGAVSQQDYDNAVQANLAAIAGVQAAQAEVDQAELNLVYTKVTSPVDGVAGLAQAQVGDLVGGSSPNPLTVVSTLDPIRVYFPISEQEYLHFAAAINRTDTEKASDKKPKTELELILADGSVYPRKGEVNFVNRQVVSTTGTIQIGASFPNPNNGLRPGQYARVRAATTIKTGALLVPQRCIVEVQGFRQVAVVGADGKVAFRPVTAGERIGSEWVIDKGLTVGERVVVEGLQKIKDGATVTTRLYDPAAKPAPASDPVPADSHKKD